MRRAFLAVGFFGILVLAVGAQLARAGQAPGEAEVGQTVAANPKRLDGLDDFVAGVMKDWKVPGLSLAVVQNGQVVFLKGYGVRDLEKKTPVTPHTLFAIGSITKSF